MLLLVCPLHAMLLTTTQTDKLELHNRKLLCTIAVWSKQTAMRHFLSLHSIVQATQLAHKHGNQCQ